MFVLPHQFGHNEFQECFFVLCGQFQCLEYWALLQILLLESSENFADGVHQSAHLFGDFNLLLLWGLEGEHLGQKSFTFGSALGSESARFLPQQLAQMPYPLGLAFILPLTPNVANPGIGFLDVEHYRELFVESWCVLSLLITVHL